MTLPQIILPALTIAAWLLFGGFAISSFRERELRAGWLALGFTLILSVTLLAPLFFGTTIQWIVTGTCGGILLLFTIAFFLPIGKAAPPQAEVSTRFDERRIVFSRNGLQPGTESYASYYATHPEDEAGDAISRNNPGLLSPGALFYEAPAFATADAIFEIIATLRKIDESQIAPEKLSITPEAASAMVKHLAKYFGALDVGICELNPAYIYTHHGRKVEEYGEPIQLAHKYAIAMTFEMDREMISSTPRPPGVVESAQQYLRAATAGLELAETIRGMGYPAMTHFDGSYQVIAPPIARDAGLGNIGRMSLLMTPRQGPRVRIGIVTTDMPLSIDQPMPDAAMLDFCSICKKCATTCPSKAIPFDGRQVKNGSLRWTINAEACYRYWTRVGTDCGVCMRVCPYAHADTLHHNLIRWGIRHSGTFRRAALVMDDIFYGKAPPAKALKDWPFSKR